MAGRNFLRTYEMKCGPMGMSGFQIGNINSNTDPALHISFSIEKEKVWSLTVCTV